MKILYVINGLGSGGAERLVSQLCAGLGNTHEITLVSLNSSKNIFSNFEKNKVKYVTFEKDGFYSFSKIKVLFNLIKNQDIVHAHLFPSLYLVGLITFFTKKPKYFFTEHNTYNKRRKFRLLLPVEKIIYSRYDCVINITPAVKFSLERWIGRKEKLEIIPNFIDVEKIKSTIPLNRNDFSYSDEDILLVMVGSFTEQKDQLTVILSLKLLPSNYKLILIGDGNLRHIIEGEILKLKLEDRVKLFGIRNDVFEIIKFCDYGLLSSHWEGFGLAALEYMAAGLITLGSNVEGLNTVITKHENLFEVGDSTNLAKRILELSSNLTMGKQILKEQNTNLNKYTIEQALSMHIEIYKEYLTSC